ncbi:Poly(ADP-ribose) polymerase, catalytic domain-containing protein [Artemisia annua]|uniref:Poly(ADP-ribose) polymerase, catalytic domain-containing protein n=1 Tax=Artemisia annua TaxID=35608 RepID=A0A2U1KIC1_ARTAN|nr:Poly(ADP-ribose) polymerase, catalytic domain-containing protein [Artemisia annua]
MLDWTQNNYDGISLPQIRYNVQHNNKNESVFGSSQSAEIIVEASAQLKIEGSERAEDLTKMGNPSEIVKDNILYPSFSNPTKIGSGESLAEMMSRRQWEVLEEVPNHMWKQVKLQFTAENEVCDQMFDDLVSLKKYIIWSNQMNTHILLEFVISFKAQRIVNRSQVNGVRLGKPVSPWISIPDLIANLSKMLHFLGASIWELCFTSVESLAVSNITLGAFCILKSVPNES